MMMMQDITLVLDWGLSFLYTHTSNNEESGTVWGAEQTPTPTHFPLKKLGLYISIIIV